MATAAAGLDPSDFDAVQLAQGTLHETKKSKDFLIAMGIAMGRLHEDPSYYSRRAKRKLPSRKKPKATTTRKRGGSSRRVNQLVRDQFRDIYDR